MKDIIPFVKMHGAGNDYIFVDCLNDDIPDKIRLARVMSDRHFGVGGDGAVFLCPSDIADVLMLMFNADGSEGNMCGNAIRCVARYLYENGYPERLKIATKSGVKRVVYSPDKQTATVNMGTPNFKRGFRHELFDGKISVDGKELSASFVSMGNPHIVVFDSAFDLRLAKELERHPMTIDRANVEFVKVTPRGLSVKVYERGSGVTLACGTGGAAAAVIAVRKGIYASGEDITVIMDGGELTINYTDTVLLTGNAVKVYQGEFYDKVHFCDRRRGQRIR